jgi:hypothetical protein
MSTKMQIKLNAAARLTAAAVTEDTQAELLVELRTRSPLIRTSKITQEGYSYSSGTHLVFPIGTAADVIQELVKLGWSKKRKLQGSLHPVVSTWELSRTDGTWPLMLLCKSDGSCGLKVYDVDTVKDLNF